MKLTFKQFLVERYQFEIDGYGYYEYDDVEEDNIKTWHIITPPGGKETALHHTPYEHLSKEDVTKYVEFHKKYDRFPQYGEFGGGNLSKDQLHKLETK